MGHRQTLRLQNATTITEQYPQDVRENSCLRKLNMLTHIDFEYVYK